MNIRDPLVHATYFYLREAPGDNEARRYDRHAAFVADAQVFLQNISGWLAMTPPTLPEIPVWDREPPADVQPLITPNELQGRTSAAAWLSAYVLRNMLLLRVVIMRAGDHPQTVWSMLDEALGDAPTTTLSWLHTARYWCGVAPRPPEEFEQDRQRAIKTPFGVLCLGGATTPHLLVYPDARTEKRAGAYLKSLAAQLEWYPVQARFRLQRYTDYAANAARNQQRALEQVTRSAQFWSVPQDEHRLRSLNPLQVDLDMLESTYASVLSDLTATRGAAQEVRALMSEYRLQLMQSGLWDIAPSVWEAQVAGLAGVQAQIEDDVQHIDSTLRRLELLIQMLQTRVSLLQSERERVLIYLVALLGLAVVAVLVADTSLTRMGMRLLALAAVVAGVGFAWQRWLRSRVP